MNALLSLGAIVALLAVAWLGADLAGQKAIFGIVIPYLALAVFMGGIIFRVWKWAMAPVPFRTPTITGQQKSLSWIKSDHLESPSCTVGVIGRMALEILFFRSLLRNTRSELKEGPRLVYGNTKWLWLAGLAFHWSFLLILLRHLRFFTDPVPRFVLFLQDMDGFFQIFVPVLYLTDIVIIGALTYLFLRRVVLPQVRYISLAADYFPLFLILGIATSGVLMRYFTKVNVMDVKELAMSLVTFKPAIPEGDGIGLIFWIHLLLVCVLVAYFPFSKLMHLGGVFLSPTRNLANNNRAVRHINPWNPEVKTHTYEEYEDEFRDLMKGAGLPLEKEK
ncbi:MAG: sulfate reduction electron transfer complex DsrMKJOP subunit DsrM [Pseudomonadota bacterium]